MGGAPQYPPQVQSGTFTLDVRVTGNTAFGDGEFVDVALVEPKVTRKGIKPGLERGRRVAVAANEVAVLDAIHAILREVTPRLEREQAARLKALGYR